MDARTLTNSPNSSEFLQNRSSDLLEHDNCVVSADFASDLPRSSSDSGDSLEQGQGDLVDVIKFLFEKAYCYGSFPIVAAVQRELIINALEETSGNYVRAAEILGITRSTLRKRVAQFRIKRVFKAW